jgi:uncharacterized protein YdeI (YjbR/CyaY-like superfamily)
MEKKSIHPKSPAEWRKWLEENHDKETKIYVIKYKRHTGKPTISHQESMDEAICFGWIDTTINRLDDERYMRCFARRNKNSKWSSATIKYAQRLIKEGKMAPAGLKMYKEGLKKPLIDAGLSKNPDVPADLKKALEKNKQALKFFDSLAPSYRRSYIYWVARVKGEDTRKRVIKQVVERCKKGLKPGL